MELGQESGQKPQPNSGNKFISDEPHKDHPPLGEKDLLKPRLGRFSQEDLKLGEFIGNGAHGAIFKSSLDNGTPVVAKVFFNSERPEKPKWWPWEMECANAALLHMMRERCDQLKGEDRSLYLIDNPRDWKAALFNIRAFSDEYLMTEDPYYTERQSVGDEVRDKRFRSIAKAPGQKPFRPEVTTPRCYGWTELPGAVITEALHRSGVRDSDGTTFPKDSKSYPIIVYEFVPEGPDALKKEKVDSFIDFLRLAGFCVEPFNMINWHADGILVDHGDMISVLAGPSTWEQRTYRIVEFGSYGLSPPSSPTTEGEESRPEFNQQPKVHPSKEPQRPQHRYLNYGRFL